MRGPPMLAPYGELQDGLYLTSDLQDHYSWMLSRRVRRGVRILVMVLPIAPVV